MRSLNQEIHCHYQAGRITEHDERAPRLQIKTDRRTWPLMELGLLGAHQADNAAVAVACVEQLQKAGIPIPDRAVSEGLASVQWPARLEVVRRQPMLLLDCAHNVASAEALIETLLDTFPPQRRILVFAGSNDKDLRGMIRVLLPHFAHVVFTRYSISPRGVPADQLAALLDPSTSTSHTVCSGVHEAWRTALELAKPHDMICVTGSVFLAGEMRELLLKCP